MADLTGTTPADTYKGLLQVNDYTDGIASNTGSNALAIQDGAGNATALALSTTRVGVGNNSPQATLDVSGNVVADEYALDGTGSSTSAVAIHAPATNEIAIRTNSTDRVRIDNSGKVGIGTTSPSARLNIVDAHGNGSASASGQLILSNIHTDGGTWGIHTTALNWNVGGGGKLGFFADNNADNARMIITQEGNVGIGALTFGTSAAGVIGIKNGTAPTSSPADMVQLYAKDDAGSSRLYVRNEAGTETVLSPHAADAPSSLYDRPPGVEEMHRSANYYLGTIVFTNVDRRNDLMQKQLNGEELPEDRTFTVTETFAEYNARTGADLQVEDWDANQQAMADADESYVKKPKPDWLS